MGKAMFDGEPIPSATRATWFNWADATLGKIKRAIARTCRWTGSDRGWRCPASLLGAPCRLRGSIGPVPGRADQLKA